jgi:hypothetical protein
MLNKLKRFNRGVVLAIVAAISLTIFIAVDEATFRNEVPQIQARILEFIEEMERIAVMPQQFQSNSEALLEGGREMERQFNTVLDNFMIHRTDELANAMGRFWFDDKLALSTNARSFEHNYGYITSATYDVDFRTARVRKTGPGRGTVEFSYNVQVELTVPADIFERMQTETRFDPWGSHHDNAIHLDMRYPAPNGLGWMWGYIPRPPEGTPAEDIKMVMNSRGEAAFSVRRTSGGDWMLDGIGGWANGDAQLVGGHQSNTDPPGERVPVRTAPTSPTSPTSPETSDPDTQTTQSGEEGGQ